MGANDLRANHAMTEIPMLCHRFCTDFFEEAGPPTARVKFAVAGKERF